MKIEEHDILLVLRPPKRWREHKRLHQNKLLLKNTARQYGFQCIVLDKAQHGLPATIPLPTVDEVRRRLREQDRKAIDECSACTTCAPID